MRLIVNIDDDIFEQDALQVVSMVIDHGLVCQNGNAYCYVTGFDNGLIVFADKTKTGHSFKVKKDLSQ